MKLKFIKRKDNDIHIEIIEGSDSRKFDYVYFIDSAYKKRILDDPVFEGDFLVPERERILEMNNELKKIIIPIRRRSKPAQ